MLNVLKNVFVCLTLITHYVNGDIEGFVVGGEFTKIKKYPHAAFLHTTCANKAWICGASVVNQKILITAAHCVDECSLIDDGTNTAKVFLGHEKLKEATILRTAQNIVRHAGYEDVKADYDIALVAVNSDIPLGKFIKRVIITPDFPPVHEGYVAGWGSTETEKMSPVLKHVYQRLRSRETCNQHGQLHMGVFCCTGRGASAPNGGDSGSGLMTTKFHQIGLVSYRIERFPKLLIYTNVSYFFDWVTKKAKSLYCGTAL